MASPRRSSVVHRGAFRLAAILLVSSSPKKVRAFVPAAGGGIASCSRQQQQQHMKQRDAWSAGVVDVIPCAATKTWGSREGGSGAVPTAGRVRRWDAQLAATPEGVEASSSNEGAVGEGGERSSDGSSASSSAEEDAVWARAQLPMSNDMQVEQATRAVWQALSDGKNRQVLRLSLPLIGATEMDDWPGGDRQRYKACGPMVDTLLRGNPAAKEGASIVEQILDESDAVGLMQLQCETAKDDASAMIFPTTDTLSMQQQVTAGAGSRLVALVNPAWKSASDFGLFKAGEAKKALSEFEVTYSLQSLVVYGYTLRLLYCYPGPWRLFLVDEDTGKRELLGTWEKNPPQNEEVERAIFDKKGKPNASERVQASARFFQDGM